MYSLNKNKLYLKPGETYRLHVKAINIKCSFKSSNIRVACVDFTGRILALQKGRTVITVTINNDYSVKCLVLVSE